MNLEEYYSKAKEKQKVHKKFLQKVKNKKPKKLDDSVLDIHNEVFDEINCLECANCCKTTGPLFTRQDITRIAKHFKIKEKEFEETYLRIDEDNDFVLKSVPCTFLDENNYCMIYDVRPKACREFPHTDRKNIYQINHLTIKNTLICPAAYEVVEKMMERINL